MTHDVDDAVDAAHVEQLGDIRLQGAHRQAAAGGDDVLGDGEERTQARARHIIQVFEVDQQPSDARIDDPEGFGLERRTVRPIEAPF